MSAVHDPFVVKLAARLAPLEGPMGSARASLRRAHSSSAEPNVDAAVERDARACLYALADVSKSEYACCEFSRSALVRMACAGRGAGGRGRLYCEMGFAVEAIENTGDAGTGGSCEGDGEAARVSSVDAMMSLRLCFGGAVSEALFTRGEDDWCVGQVGREDR